MKMKNEYRATSNGNCYRIYFLDGSFFIIDATDFPAVSEFTWALGKLAEYTRISLFLVKFTCTRPMCMGTRQTGRVKFQ